MNISVDSAQTISFTSSSHYPFYILTLHPLPHTHHGSPSASTQAVDGGAQVEEVDRAQLASEGGSRTAQSQSQRSQSQVSPSHRGL
jgi:hypothetical protein